MLSSGDENADDTRMATDPGDHYREGWNSGFWAYYVRTSGSESWNSPASGASDRILTDGVWDGYSFAPGFDGPPPGDPAIAQIPEPRPVQLLLFGFLTALCIRGWRA